MQKSIIARVVSILFVILLIGGAIGLFFIPQLYDLTKASSVLFKNKALYYKGIFYICYIISFIIIYILFKIFNFIYNKNPFQNNIERYIKILAVLFMSLALIVGIKTIFLPTILSIVVVVLTFIISLCFYVVAEVFKVAINYKEEIDYTV